MYKCPHCKKPTISIIDKCKIGPLTNITCENCNKRIGMKKGFAFVFGLPIFILWIIFLNIGINSISVIYIIGGLVVTFVLQLIFIPLEEK